MGGARALAALGLLGGCRAMIWAPKNPKNSMWCEPLSPLPTPHPGLTQTGATPHTGRALAAALPALPQR